MKLKPRLAAIAKMIPAGTKVADIGTDHAYLPVYLVLQGHIAFAVAGETHDGPFQSARETIERLALGHHIDLRRGDGLHILRPGEVEVVVIAGMGGTTITSILAAVPAVAQRLQRLVLQPMTGAGEVRRWLLQHGWALVEESLAEEDGKLYEIIAAAPAGVGIAAVEDDLLLEIGPLLLRNGHPLLAKHIAAVTARYRQIVAAMAGSGQAAHTEKFQDYRRRLARLEGLLLCR